MRRPVTVAVRTDEKSRGSSSTPSTRIRLECGGARLVVQVSAPVGEPGEAFGVDPRVAQGARDHGQRGAVPVEGHGRIRVLGALRPYSGSFATISARAAAPALARRHASTVITASAIHTKPNPSHRPAGMASWK